ncbi:MAG TPA: hypothetical protein VN519_15875 [Bryobacteraceae bacterium]|nr:hypothetical protein [Bryobacteraceae bacterium]
MIRLSLLVFFSAAALCAQDISVDGGPAWGDFSILFTPKIEPAGAGSAQLNSAVIDAAVTGTAHRFIYDEKNKRAFGYDVSLEPSADGSTAQLRIEPLSDSQWAVRNGWAMWGSAPSGLPKYPIIPNLKIGDKIVLDLLVNPATGQKIVDYLTLIQAHAPIGPPHDFSLSDVLMTLDAPAVFVNGKSLLNPGKPLGAVSGRAIALYAEGYGRLIFSLFPQPALGFRRSGVIAGNTLTFRIGATEFRIVSKSPVAPGDGQYNLYLFSDPDWRPAMATRPVTTAASGSAESFLRSH